MNQYSALKQKHEKEVNEFPMVFAFDNNQFNEAMEKLGFSANTRDYVGNVVSIGGGGFIKKTDSVALHELLDKHENERVAAIESDETGDGFIYDMFYYELCNHEFCITWDVTDTLNALGMSIEDINADEKLKQSLNKAKKAAGKDY